MIHTLDCLNWHLEIDLKGGRIIELSRSGEAVLGTFARIDGKTGNTHICVPNFGNEGTAQFGLPFHGPARNLEWQTEHITGDSLTILCELPPSASYTGELYAAQVFELKKDSFSHTVTVENTGESAAPVNVGIHNYWATPDGWEGAKLNGTDITAQIRENGSGSLRKSNTITFPGGRKYKLKVKGFSDMMFWSAGSGGQNDRSYACLEPVHLLSDPPKALKEKMLQPGRQRTVSQEIFLG